MKIWIDADATPRDVKEIVFRAAKRLDIPTVLVANKRLDTPLGNPMITAVQVPGGPDVADQHIVDHAHRGLLGAEHDPAGRLHGPQVGARTRRGTGGADSTRIADD